MKGKNYSMNNTGKRRKGDTYYTHKSMVTQFLDAHGVLEGTVLEPACGVNGKCTPIVDVLKERKYGKKLTAYDITSGKDFFNETRNFTTIITNPPYSKAFEFIRHAKTLATREVIMLLPLSYLHGKQRFDKFYCDKEFPLSRVYVFTRYPMLGDKLRPDGKYRTGMQVYAWFVFRKDVTLKPVIDWIDNDCYVLKRGR